VGDRAAARGEQLDVPLRNLITGRMARENIVNPITDQVIVRENEIIDEAEARARTIQATRRFARRQDAWFRKDPRISWLRFDADDLVEQALDRLD